MSVSAVDTPERAPGSVASRIIDGVRHAAHMSHDARMMKTLAEDAVEDAVHMGKRTVKKSLHKLEDVADEGVRYVKRQPLKTVAGAVGTGLVVGLAVGWLAGRRALRTRAK